MNQKLNISHKIKLKSENDLAEFKNELVRLSVKGLSDMFDIDRQLFYLKTKRNERGKLEKFGHSVRYTIISLLGLCKHDIHDPEYPINIRNILTNLLNKISEMDNIGDMGLLVWLISLTLPEKLEKFFSHMDEDTILRQFPDGRAGSTMELSWFLTGLSYSAFIHDEYKVKYEGLTNKIYNLVISNYGGKGIFGHQNKRLSLTGKIRGRLGSFADQVYPIYALTQFSKAFNRPDALNIAIEGAETICRLQGPLGQWWWHYDSESGAVVGRYPVYSVHQDGMAPMALYAVSKATGKDFRVQINNGLQWINGNNELNCDMVDRSLNVIFRCIYGSKYRMRFEEMLSILRGTHYESNRIDLKVLYACFPYHLGWLLYAFSENGMKCID